MKKYYLNDDETLNFTSREDFQSYIDYRKETDEWKLHFINTLACYGVNKLPLFTPSDCKNIKVDMGTYHIDVKDINSAGKEEQECIDAELPFLCIPEEKGYRAIPTRGIAYNTILQRAEGSPFRRAKSSNICFWLDMELLSPCNSCISRCSTISNSSSHR